MSVFTDGHNCENKNVHMRAEESKLITDIESGLAGMGFESALECGLELRTGNQDHPA